MIRGKAKASEAALSISINAETDLSLLIRYGQRSVSVDIWSYLDLHSSSDLSLQAEIPLKLSDVHKRTSQLIVTLIDPLPKPNVNKFGKMN